MISIFHRISDIFGSKQDPDSIISSGILGEYLSGFSWSGKVPDVYNSSDILIEKYMYKNPGSTIFDALSRLSVLVSDMSVSFFKYHLSELRPEIIDVLMSRFWMTPEQIRLFITDFGYPDLDGYIMINYFYDRSISMDLIISLTSEGFDITEHGYEYILRSSETEVPTDWMVSILGKVPGWYFLRFRKNLDTEFLITLMDYYTPICSKPEMGRLWEMIFSEQHNFSPSLIGPRESTIPTYLYTNDVRNAIREYNKTKNKQE